MTPAQKRRPEANDARPKRGCTGARRDSSNDRAWKPNTQWVLMTTRPSLLDLQKKLNKKVNVQACFTMACQSGLLRRLSAPVVVRKHYTRVVPHSATDESKVIMSGGHGSCTKLTPRTKRRKHTEGGKHCGQSLPCLNKQHSSSLDARTSRSPRVCNGM